MQGALAGRRLDRLEVEAVEGALADQPLDFGGDLGGDRGPEPLFFAEGGLFAFRRVSQIRSLTSMSSLVRFRRRWHSATCSRVAFKA